MAGFPMLPVIDPKGIRAGRQAVAYAVLLLPVSAAPAWVGISGSVYFVCAIAFSLGLLGLAVRFAAARSDHRGRYLFVGLKPWRI